METDKIKVIDFRSTIEKPEDKIENIELKLSTGVWNTIDYIVMSPLNIKQIKKDKELTERVLELINIIYVEHSKLAIIGCIYPIFNIFGYKTELDCEIISFSKSGVKLDKYVVKPHITSINLSSYNQCTLSELVLQSKIRLKSIGSNEHIKITGLENITSVNKYNQRVIYYNIEKYHNGVMSFKYLSHFSVDYIINKSITKIVLEDTCTITNISNKILDIFPNLEEIVFPTWAKPASLGNKEEKQFIMGKIPLAFRLKDRCGKLVINLYNDREPDYVKVTFGQGDKIHE